MKFRRTVSSVIASVFVVLAVLLIVVQFRLATFGMNKVRSLIPKALAASFRFQRWASNAWIIISFS